jgi:phosphate:Na+ symporter
MDIVFYKDKYHCFAKIILFESGYSSIIIILLGRCNFIFVFMEYREIFEKLLHVDYWRMALVVFSAVILFLYSLHGFSKEIQKAGQERLHSWLSKATNNRIKAFFLGAIFTGILQSSSAVSSMTVALVDAQIIGLFNSLPVLLGANVGTATTAWMVSFKLTGIGPLFIVVGTLLGLLPKDYRIIGKSIFYLGFIFFCLDLIGQSLMPVREHPAILKLLSGNYIWINVLAGMLVTSLVQSSSVTTGLAVLLAQQGILDLNSALAVVIGSNIGTTSTALIASIGLNTASRMSAIANFIFNFTGVVIVLILFPLYTGVIALIHVPTDMAVAMGHLLLNMLIAVIFLVLLNPFYKLLIRLQFRFFPIKKP